MIHSLPCYPKLENLQICLASSSPRRLLILNTAGINPILVIKPPFEENIPRTEKQSPTEFARMNAYQKAISVAQLIWPKNSTSQSIANIQDNKYPKIDIILSCDTIVEYDNHIYGKPLNPSHATQMLRCLANHTHNVISSVSLIHRADWIQNDLLDSKHPIGCLFDEVSQVTFIDNISDEMIQQYVASQDGFDKAGGYSIQGKGCCLVKSIVGCYWNIVGLPISHLLSELNYYCVSKYIQI